MSAFYVGEALVIEGSDLDNVAHIDLMIGPKDGPVGVAFANALANNKDGFTTLLAVVAPNLPAKPDTLLFNKVTIKGAKQAVQMFGPAQAAVARAVVDSVESGVIPKDKADDLCVLVGVFIHWEAASDDKIFEYNYKATKEAIARALKNEPKTVKVRVFFGSWCPHCRTHIPFLLRVEDELRGSHVTFEYIGLPRPPQAWQDPEVKRLKIGGVPTGVVYVGGKEVGRITGEGWNAPEVLLNKIVNSPAAKGK